jgi:uncharacterized repeat protein (TIGR03809 family)
VALKWRAIAEQRRDHFFDLYQSGRWKHYYEGQAFLNAMRAAVELAERWALIAPRPEELVVAEDGFPLFDEAGSLSHDPAPALVGGADALPTAA